MKQKKIIKFIIGIVIICLILIILKNTVNSATETLKNTTRIYFSSAVTKGYGTGDCILLENYDANGNKHYGLIDTGLKSYEGTNYESAIACQFLQAHGVNKTTRIRVPINNT